MIISRRDSWREVKRFIKFKGLRIKLKKSELGCSATAS